MKSSTKLIAQWTGVILAVLVWLPLSGCQSYTTGLQKGRTVADETAVVATLQTVAKAQDSYAVNSEGEYGTFPELTRQGLLDARFASEKPQVRGYMLTMTTGDKEFRCNADPANGESGKHFYIDSDSRVIRVNPSRPATASDPAHER